MDSMDAMDALPLDVDATELVEAGFCNDFDLCHFQPWAGPVWGPMLVPADTRGDVPGVVPEMDAIAHTNEILGDPEARP